MKLIIFGASRGVGRALTEQALAHGHQITAVAREREALTLTHPALCNLPGDVTDAGFVSVATPGHDVVFCTLGADKRGPTTLYSTAARNIVTSMAAHGLRRLIFLSNFGVLSETAQDVSGTALLLLARVMLRDTLADHRRALYEMRRWDLDWTAVRPMRLTDGPFTGRYRIALDGIPRGGTNISRADVADFMLRQASSDEYVRQVPAIAY